jgi:signal transduction histidine kinase/CheY-like chemotaxis protein/CHASE3 domain sensor protein
MNQNSPSSIIRQLQLVFGISITLLLISSVASFYSNKKLITASGAVNHTNEVILSTESLISSIKDAETGQRGYVITNDPSFLDRFTGGLERTMVIWARLKTLTSDNETQQAYLTRLRSLINERYSQMNRTYRISATIPQNKRAELFIQSHEEMLRGKKIMDELRANIEAMKREEDRLLKIRLGKQDLYTTYTPILVVIAAIISILISLIAYIRIKSDLEARLRKQKEDELKYIETNKRIGAIEQVARKIAAGDYTVRSADEAKDELGRISAALNNMVGALENSFTELQQKNWLQTGAVNLGNAIRDERFTKQVADKIINSIATYVRASVGTLYVADGDEGLKLRGSYAATGAPEIMPAAGGIIGQAIESRVPIVSDHLPPGYLKIASSIGSSSPAYAIVLPLIHGEQVVGAMELGMLQPPGERELLFLDSNMEAMAISLNAAMNFEKLQDLLEETQAQAEELQAQHTELESINAELEIQTEKLQSSEEELRVQQEELQQANVELEERSRLLEERNKEITSRNREVQRQAQELAASSRYKSEFLANMSHELRTPLNSILLLSRLLAENNDASLNPDQVEYARVIQSSGNGLLQLIDEILDLSKIEAGKMELEFEPVSVAEVLEDMRSLFEPVASEKNVDFHVSVSPEVQPLIETDKLRLEQVLKNLISNALKFTRQGSVSVTAARDAARDGYISFSVADTGIGIPEEKQGLIFEAFRQADGSTRRKYGGTGLGLSISRELSRLLGGGIGLQSKPDEGSTFTIFIPVARPENTEPAQAGQAGQAAEPALPQETPAAEKTDYAQFITACIPESIPDDRDAIKSEDKLILIVEDDILFARSMLDFTRRKGYKGIVSVRGDEGLELARRYKPAGILLDLQLPVKSGWQVMEALKADPATRHIPVHIMSAHSVKKESLLKGAINFIDKPVALEQLQEVFNKLEYVLNRTEKKVLIVEDNPQHAKALAYFLESFHINSEIKTTIPESVEALKQEDADCVILDTGGLADGKAYATLEEIKRNHGLEHLPIIVFTGKSLSLGEEQRIKQYADSIVVKTAHSFRRILDEVSLFLHLVEERTANPADQGSRKLGSLAEILKDKTVLVVDDDVRNIFSLTRSLEGAGMQIVTAVDGKEAMEKLHGGRKIDVVLLDMMMPQMDGYETARRIRQNPAWKKLPVIAVTAKAMSGDREKCIRAGASDYITKPIDIDQLMSLLRVWLYERGTAVN